MQELIAKLHSEYSAYSAKPSKASAKRLRDLLNHIQKGAVSEKKRLIAADAVGY